MAGTIAFIAQTGNLASQTTYNYTTQSLGTASTDRVILTHITCRKGGVGALTVTGVTIAGITATVVQRLNAVANENLVAIAYAAVPTGTSGTISVVFSSAPARSTIANYQLTGIDSSSTFDNQNSVAAAPTVNLNVPAGGVATMNALTAAPTSCTWTGLTEDYDAQQSTFENYTGSSNAFASTQTALAITATFASGATESVGIAISFSQASVGGTVTAPAMALMGIG